MRKIVKITALMLMLVMTMVMASGCLSSSVDGDDVEVKTAEITIGLPYNSESAIWADLQTMIEDFEFMNDAQVTLVEVPDAASEDYAKFLDQVYDGKVDLFLGSSSVDLEKLIEDGKIAPATTINNKDNRFYENHVTVYKEISRELDRLSYSVPFNASYQGLFLNKDIFEQYKIELPTDWDSLNAAIAAFKETPVTPIAAGFADGAGYWIEEMILVEGGVAEHSATPAKGVINSWSRAIADIKNFYDAGAFSADAATNTHDIAVADFINGKAAMIVCSSMDLAGSIDGDNMVFMSFPKSPTGIKEEGTIIAKTESAFYINSRSLTKNVDDVTALSGIMVEFINSYMASSDYYPTLFAEEGMFPVNKLGADAMDDNLETSVYDIVTATTVADMPMDLYMLTLEDMKSSLVDVLTGTVTAEEYLTTVSEAEIEAQAEKRAAELEEK